MPGLGKRPNLLTSLSQGTIKAMCHTLQKNSRPQARFEHYIRTSTFSAIFIKLRSRRANLVSTPISASILELRLCVKKISIGMSCLPSSFSHHFTSQGSVHAKPQLVKLFCQKQTSLDGPSSWTGNAQTFCIWNQVAKSKFQRAHIPE